MTVWILGSRFLSTPPSLVASACITVALRNYSKSDRSIATHKSPDASKSCASDESANTDKSSTITTDKAAAAIKLTTVESPQESHLCRLCVIANIDIVSFHFFISKYTNILIIKRKISDVRVLSYFYENSFFQEYTG